MTLRTKNGKARWRQTMDIILGIPWRKWRGWRERRRTLHQLRSLNSEQLKDIGLTSHDVDSFR